MLISLVKDLYEELDSIRKINKIASSRIILAKKFTKFIQFHSDAKQLSEQSFGNSNVEFK